MKKRKIKSSSNMIFLIIVVIVILMFILGRKGGGEIDVLEENMGLEESVGSGFLDIVTIPEDAEIFLDDVFSGKSPTTLYHIPVGTYDVVIKKDGYENFLCQISIDAGKKAFLEASLVLAKAEEEVKVIEIVEDKEETSTETPKADKIINIGGKHLLYYDFSEEKVTDKMHYGADVFSKRYDNHFVFTRYSPANIKIINKKIDEMKKEDCVGIQGSYELLYSGQSLCVITKEKEIVAIGGDWENTINTELSWKLFD